MGELWRVPTHCDQCGKELPRNVNTIAISERSIRGCPLPVRCDCGRYLMVHGITFTWGPPTDMPTPDPSLLAAKEMR